MSAVVAHPVGDGAERRQTVRIEAASDGVAVSDDMLPREEPASPTDDRAPLLYFPDGRRYAVEDTLALDTVLAEARLRQNRRRGPAAWLAWQIAALLLLVLAAVATFAHQWTLPAMARVLAEGVSSHMLRSASEQALARLDVTWLAPSELDDAHQNALRARFATLKLPGGEPIAWRVLFRAGGRSGATAFSLPDGDIVLTDELVMRARSDDEVVAVLAHEFGRLQRDDAMRALARQSPWLVLRSWLWSEKQVARLAQGLLDTPPPPADEGFAAGLLAANHIDHRALGLLRALHDQPRPGALPSLLKGH